MIELKQNTPDGKHDHQEAARPAEGRRGDAHPRLTSDSSFEKWIKDSRFGKMGDARKGGAIIVYDFEGNAVKRYKLTNAWPKSLEVGALKAGDTSVAHREAGRRLREHGSRVMRRSSPASPAPAVALAAVRVGRTPAAGASAPSRTRRPLRTEFAFELPRGYVDDAGTVHRDGVDAPGDRPRRARAAAGRPGAGEPGVPDGRAARPG